MNKILVTGAKGQLGSAIKKHSGKLVDADIIFTDERELDITDPQEVARYFAAHKPDYCINCAAYTAVDKAEVERDLAFSINKKGVQNLVNEAVKYGTVLIQVSTDFVFDGNKGTSYKETDTPNPISVYGHSKYEAENTIIDNMENYFIVRTAWVFSEFGNNFFKTMIRLGKEKHQIKVVNDQFGSPTYACDLANFILSLTHPERTEFGLYHFANQGVANWFEFAKQILGLSNPEVEVIPIGSSDFESLAKRPFNSSLDTSKTQQTFKIKIRDWRESLNECFEQYILMEKKSTFSK